MTVGWTARNLPGVEYRQAQTALSAYFIKEAGKFELAYPTPVLGKPWSIPMEFPLYQWMVVTVHHVTGLGLVKSARAVSMACFYLMLPAVFLLLGNWRLPMAHRGVVIWGGPSGLREPCPIRRLWLETGIDWTNCPWISGNVSPACDRCRFDFSALLSPLCRC